MKTKPVPNVFDQLMASRLWAYAVLAADYATAKLSEESSWRGIIGILTGLGIYVDPSKSAQFISLGMIIIGAINFVKRDQRKFIAHLEQKALDTRPKKRSTSASKRTDKSVTKKPAARRRKLLPMYDLPAEPPKPAHTIHAAQRRTPAKH